MPPLWGRGEGRERLGALKEMSLWFRSEERAGLVQQEWEVG